MIAYDEINKWLQSYYDDNTECTVFELILCIVLVPEKIKHIILFSCLYLFQNGLIDFFNSMGSHFISKHNAI